MLGKPLFICCGIALATAPGSTETRSDAVVGGPLARSHLNTHSDDHGYLPGRRSFYNYPRHHHVDGSGAEDGSFGRYINGGRDSSPKLDDKYGSPFYGSNYGAPYYGGGYYDDGVYYRERRD